MFVNKTVHVLVSQYAPKTMCGRDPTNFNISHGMRSRGPHNPWMVMETTKLNLANKLGKGVLCKRCQKSWNLRYPDHAFLEY